MIHFPEYSILNIFCENDSAMLQIMNNDNTLLIKKCLLCLFSSELLGVFH